MRRSACVRYEELLRYCEGDVSQLRARDIDVHLASCGACANDLEQLRSTIVALEAASEEEADLDLAADVRRALATEAGSPQRGRAPLSSTLVAWMRPRALAFSSGGLLAVSAGLALAILPARHDDQSPGAAEFRARGAVEATGPEVMPAAGAASVAVFAVRGEAAVPVEGPLRTHEPLVFAYSGAGASSYTHLMIFALDQGGGVFWFYPAYTDARHDPEAVAITPGAKQVFLPEQVRHAFQPGPLVIYGLFARNALHVSAVEAWARELVAQRRWQTDPPPSPPFPDTHASAIHVEVAP